MVFYESNITGKTGESFIIGKNSFIWESCSYKLIIPLPSTYYYLLSGTKTISYGTLASY